MTDGSDSQWRELFAHIDDGIMIVEVVRDSSGAARTWRFLEINDAWQRISGLSRDSALGRNVDDVIPGVEPEWLHRYIHVAATGEPAIFRMPLQALDQMYDIKAFRVAPDRVGVLFREISAHQREEALRSALLEISERLRDLTDPPAMTFAAAEIIGRTLGVIRAGYATITDQGASFQIDRDWSEPGFESGVGIHLSASFGKAVGDLENGQPVVISDIMTDARTAGVGVAGLQAYAARALINLPLMENGRTVAFFYVNNHAPRTWMPEEVEFVRKAAEQIRVVVERRRAEQGLRQLASSLEKQVEIRTTELNRLWETSPDLLLVLDFNGVIQRVNPAWTSLLGYAHDELVGQQVNAFALLADHPQTVDDYALIAKGSVARFVNRYHHKDGAIHWISWVAASTESIIYATGRDITAEREQAAALEKAEEALRQSQKMEAVGQLTGGLAHDFNNLLASISGGLQVLKVKLQRGHYTGLERYIDIGESSVRRAASLTQRLLAFSRRQTLDPKPTDVKRLIAGMEELLRRSIGPMIELDIVNAPDLWLAKVDTPQLENALLNLCINARDAMMPGGGRLTLLMANERIDERSMEQGMLAGEYIALRIVDTGIGMTADVVARIFDPFFTTKPLGEGTGLGLSMVYGFARQSDGQVRVHSEVGVGTTMCLYLPRYTGTVHPEEPAETVLIESGQGETVLLIEDERALRDIVEEVLHDAGYCVLTAQDGPTGLQILGSNKSVDLLVTDVGLPGGLNGRQVADAARVTRPHLKVLFITGYADTAAVGNGLLDHGMEVMTKPFELSALTSKVRTLINSHVPR